MRAGWRLLLRSRRELLADFVGTALPLVAVVRSGVTGERLAGANAAVALPANAIATGAALPVLINVFRPVVGQVGIGWWHPRQRTMAA